MLGEPHRRRLATLADVSRYGLHSQFCSYMRAPINKVQFGIQLRQVIDLHDRDWFEQSLVVSGPFQKDLGQLLDGIPHDFRIEGANRAVGDVANRY
jgi:hypothetical protein